MPSTFANPSTGQVISLHRIDSLDGIRAMAAAFVMIFHFVGHHGESKWIVQASTIGQTGVDLFFVLSGFLITRILLYSRASPHYFRTFFLRRALRIFPLYYGFLTIYFFVPPLISHSPIPSFPSQLWSWLYLQDLPATFASLHSTGPAHFWSLAVEEHFYFIWPAMIFVLSRKRLPLLILATLVVPALLRVAFLHYGIGVFFFTLTRFDGLGFGALLAFLFAGEPWPMRHIGMFRYLLIGLGLLLVPSFAVLSGSRYDWLQVVKPSLISAFYFSLIGFCISDAAARSLVRLFCIKPLRWLGSISYGLYVFHPTCFAIVHRLVAPPEFFIDATLSFGLTIALAYISYYFFESPILGLRRYFRYETELVGS